MRAASFLRGRQELQELRYWLALVGYDPLDRSFVNRVYLLYLVIFFAGWFLALFVFLASGLVKISPVAGPGVITPVLVILELLILFIWVSVSIWRAYKSSPLILAETDLVILSQTPIPRAKVILRWFWQPWAKSFLLLGTVMLLAGLILSEASGLNSLHDLVPYLLAGVRNVLVFLPIHLALQALLWVIGLISFRQSRKLAWLKPVITAAILLPMMTAAASALLPDRRLLPLKSAGGWLLSILQAGLLQTRLFIPMAPLMIAALLALLLLYLISGDVHLSRLASTTTLIERTASLRRFGFSESADNEVLKSRLISRQPGRQAAPPAGWRAFLWMTRMQSVRRMQLSALQPWLMLFSYAFSLTILPLSPFSFLLLLLFIQQLAQSGTGSLRHAMGRWGIIRQMPVSPWEIIKALMLPPALLVVLLAVLGAALASLVSRQLMFAQLILLPLFSLMVLMLAGWDCLNNSRGLDLMSEAPAHSSYRTILTALVVGAVFGLIFSARPLAGMLTALVLTLLITLRTCHMAKTAWQKLLLP